MIVADFKDVGLYNLDVIISVGYRVKSQRGVEFRRRTHSHDRLLLPALRFWYNVCNMMLSQESVAGESMANCGQWHLEREIGHGAYGVVFLAEGPDGAPAGSATRTGW